jgi:hypothetical protein
MFKKLIISAVIVATATGAMARDITVTFADGSKHQYLNTPESVTPEQIIDRAGMDFPNRTLVNVDGGRPPVDDTPFWDTTGGKITRAVLVIGGVILIGRALHLGNSLCHTGPRGGTYTITSGGNKNYAGC